MSPLSIWVLAATAFALQSPVLDGRFASGPFEAVFDSAGRYRFLRGGAVGLQGSRALRGDTVTFTDDGGPAACIGVPGRYRFALQGDTLRFNLVADECAGRRTALGRPWIRPGSGAVALTGVTLIDGTGAAARPATTIVIRDSTIADVFPDASKALPSDVTVLPLPGRYVIPGLIDAHVHLATSPGGAAWRTEVEASLRHALAGGVTTVRDMGGDARVLADLARAASVGGLDAPTIRFAALFGGPAFFEDPRVRASSRGVRVGEAPWAQAVTAATSWPLAIALARGSGATGIKLYAELPPELVGPIVREAHRQGLKVWSHATLVPARPRDAVAAGVDVLSHASLLVWEGVDATPERSATGTRALYARVAADHPRLARLWREMAARGVALDPTLYVTRERAEALAWAAAVTRAAHAAGVSIVAGTDAMGHPNDGPLPHLHDEMELLVTQAGLTPLAAITAATANAARALGIATTHGLIAPGMAADLVVLAADPSVDIRHTRQIVAVYRAGRRVERTPR